MALPPSNTSEETFMREVDEEYRREQLLGFWNKWGRILVGAVIVGLVAFAGYLYFSHRSDAVAGQQGEQFDLALADAAQPTKADPILSKLAADGNPGYSAMARLNQAEALLNKKDTKGAAALYAAMVADTKLPQPFRDRALIQQTIAEYDGLQPQQIIDRMKPLATAESPWFGPAGELVASAYMQQGKRLEAGKIFAQIAQSKGYVPDTIRQRSVQMAGVLGVDANDKTEEKKAQ